MATLNNNQDNAAPSATIMSASFEDALSKALYEAIANDEKLSRETGNIRVDLRDNGTVCRVTAQLPYTISTTSTGTFEIKASNYLDVPNPPLGLVKNITPGTTLKATHWPAAVLEIVSRMMELEKSQDIPRRLTLSFNSGSRDLTISGNFDCVRTIQANGDISISIHEYIPNGA